MITFTQFLNDNANHHSFVKYKTSFMNLTDDQMNQIEYEMSIDYDDYRARTCVTYKTTTTPLR